jgi:hypothetical protein
MIKRQAEGCGFLPVSMHTDAEWKYAANAARVWCETEEKTMEFFEKN